MTARILIADGDTDACPDDPDGLHHPGCGCDEYFDDATDATITCWCGREVAVDEAVEGTCGARQCLVFECMDRKGLVP